MGSVTKVVLDTNIFFSGFGWNGKPEEILKLAKALDLEMYLSF